jgi:hypothetical protein
MIVWCAASRAMRSAATMIQPRAAVAVVDVFFEERVAVRCDLFLQLSKLAFDGAFFLLCVAAHTCVQRCPVSYSWTVQLTRDLLQGPQTYCHASYILNRFHKWSDLSNRSLWILIAGQEIVTARLSSDAGGQFTYSMDYLS